MKRGLTLVELLIAMAVIGVAFAAFLSSQLLDLRLTQTAAWATETKAFANQVLEEKSGWVLRGETVSLASPYLDEERDGAGWSFWFVDYYWGCPTPLTPPPESGNRRTLRPVVCQGEERSPEGIQAQWRILGESRSTNTALGIQTEGVVLIVVTAEHPRGPRVTLGRRVTCYDVYPSPTHDHPRPCPEPGGGRP